MSLTPEDVHLKTFTPVRLREGYDMGEVDQFLDEVEAELNRLYDENQSLRSELEGMPGARFAEPTTSGATTVVEDGAEPSEAVDDADSAAPPELPVVRTVPEASSAAARLLEIATNNAEQLVSEAKNDADRILAEANAEAETLEAESKSNAERLEEEARRRSESLDAETERRRTQMVSELEQNKSSLTRELENLREFERDYRSRLTEYFTNQLAALNGDDSAGAPTTPSADSETPHRLRELLGEENHSTH